MKLCMAQFLPGARSRNGSAGCATHKPETPLEISAVPPTDLRDWFSASTLLGWVEREVERLTSEPGPRFASNDTQSEDERAAMLTILTLALASRLFASDDIARACRSEPIFRRVCRGNPPFPHELSRFRRQNRQSLERIVAGVFSRAIQRRFDLEEASPPAELQEDLRQYAAERLDLARHMDIGQEALGLAS